jgi:hypothetical protein
MKELSYWRQLMPKREPFPVVGVRISLTADSAPSQRDPTDDSARVPISTLVYQSARAL